MLVDDWRNKRLARSNFPVSWVTDVVGLVVTHTDLAAGQLHMVNWATMSPWANIVELPQMVPEANGVTEFVLPRDAAGDEVA